MAYVHGHCVVRADGLLIPYLLINLINGKHLSRILHQKKQDIVLDGRQLDGIAVHGHLFVVIIDLKAAALINLSVRLLVQVPQLGITPHLGLDPGYQLQGIKGLRDVIVSPDVKSQNFICILGLGGEDDDGYAAVLPDLQGSADAVQSRHHHIHNQ